MTSKDSKKTAAEVEHPPAIEASPEALLLQPAHEQPRHHQRHKMIPAGFIRHRGKSCPFPPCARVEVVIRTPEGFGIDGPVMALMHDWTLPKDEPGSIAAYRLVGPPKPEAARNVP